MSTYAATAERDGRFWVVHVLGDGFDHWTQARHLREVQEMARDLVATMLEIESDSFELDWSVALPATVREHLDNAARLRAESERTNREAAKEARLAARGLKDQGLTVRDIGEAMGISYQRAHQLVS